MWALAGTSIAVLDVAPVANAEQTPVDASEPTTILLTEYGLGPSDVVVAAGEVRLRLVNAGIRRHTLTALVHGVEHLSPEVRAGDAAEWQLQIDQPGRYELWCNEYRHLEKGMAGALFVRRPDASAAQMTAPISSY